jgi:hypothetical protein
LDETSNEDQEGDRQVVERSYAGGQESLQEGNKLQEDCKKDQEDQETQNPQSA